MANEPADGGSSDVWSIFKNWSISTDQFIDENANSIWGKVRWGDLFLGQLKALVALLTGLWVYYVNAVPSAIVDMLGGLRSFAVEVIGLLLDIPTMVLKGSFDTAVNTLMGSGIAGYVAAVVLLAIAFGSLSMVVNRLG